MRFLSWSLLIPVFFLVACSFLILSSISPALFRSQLVWAVLGTAVVGLFYYFDWRPFINYLWVVAAVYLSGLTLLIITYFSAPVIRGIRGWIVLGAFQFQPSEFMKIGLVLVYAYFFARYHVAIANPRTIFVSFVLLAVPAFFVILEPDLGTAIILGAVWFGFLAASGLKAKHLLLGVMIFIISSFVAWNYFLADYQRGRFFSLFNQNRDPLGLNYNVIQSKIAIGSAGWFGKGYHQGSQTQLGFLPEASADFIYSAFVEEWGLIGGFLVIAAFVYLIFVILRIGVMAPTNFEKFLCLGAAIILSSHFIINLGSALGLLPVVGIPFPFLSYGGSNLLINFFLIAIIFSIAKRTA